MQVAEINQCRVCGSTRLDEVLDLGTHCISDFVEDGGEPDRAPLVLVRCDECTLVQLKHTVPRERLYRRYWYRSGTNESMVAALQDVVGDAAAQVTPGPVTRLGPLDAWMDIGANDGTLLRMVPPAFRRIGVEPCFAFWEEAAAFLGVWDSWIPGFFPPPFEPRHNHPKVITSVAMFYDLDDPNAFVAAIKEWLHPEGIWVIQMSTLGQMLEQNAFDNVCHEHLEYYSLGSLQNLLSRHGLHIANFTANDVNGGSMRVIVRHGARQAPWGELPRLGTKREIEGFAFAVKVLRAKTLGLLETLKADGRTVLGYGASTKGNTLLQYYGIGTELLSAIADRNPDKWGRKTVGTGIPIISEDEMRDRRPDYLFALPWHFMDSFRQREAEFIGRGGRFIVPLPDLRIEGGQG